MAMTRILLAAALTASLPFAEPVAAADGRLEINQACANVGCFQGDNAGMPVEITASGSYVLTGNLNQPDSGGFGVRIQADDVSLDLNGFSMVGPGTQTGTGIYLSGIRTEVRNGRILDFGTGIFPENGAEDGHGSRAIALTVSSVGQSGAISLGDDAVVKDCVISSGGKGIRVGDRSQVVGNRLSFTAGTTADNGINGGPHSIIRENVIADAGGRGIKAGPLSIVASNIVSQSGLSGVEAIGSGSVIAGNAVFISQNFGIEVGVGTDHLIRANNAYLNNQSAGGFTNIEACPTCTLIDNHAP